MRQEATLICGLSSATSDAHLAQMLALGVGELYAGYLPPSWLARLGAEVSPNRRYVLERQVTRLDRLHSLVWTARDGGARFLLALNEHGYPPGARDLLDEIVATGLEVGVQGFIVADPALLHRLARELPSGTELVASCEAGVYSTASARMLVDLGATRIIFPRETRLDELASISAAVGEQVELEAFVAREYCLNSSALCFATHGYGQRSHFCTAPVRRRLVHLDSGEERDLPLGPPGWSTDPSYLRAVSDLHRCGLCALESLSALGVRWWKVPGRSDSALPALRRVRELLQGGHLSPGVARQQVASPAFCDSGENCYYRPRPATPPPGAPPWPGPVSRPEPAPPPRSDAPELALALEPGSPLVGWREGLAP